jgi:DNA-binding GntR family transcriptional regulator
MPITELNLPGRRPRSQELYEQLRSAVLDGTLAPGERLVEVQLARAASVSRTPVREAIRMLEADGLVQQTTIGVEVIAVSAAQLREYCELREVLEGMAGRLAAAGRSEMDLLELYRISDAYDRAVEANELDDMVQVNRLLHETVWGVAGNSALFKTLHDLRSRIDAIQSTSLRDPERQRVAMAEHRLFLDALREQDEVRAEDLARTHFRQSMAIRLTMARGGGLPAPA